MNENPTAPMEPPAPVEPVQETPVQEPPVQDPVQDPEQAPKKKRLRPGRIAAVAGAVLLLGAVIGGVGYTVVTVQDADRDAGAPRWRLPAAEHGVVKVKEGTGLGGMLVPFGPDGWNRGPDIAEFGSDAELSGRQATALRKESLRDLPRSTRRQLEKEIDKERIKGMAMRSYYDSINIDPPTVSIVLSQMENKAAIRDSVKFQNEFLNALKVFRKGPEIKGHKNAHCFLPPKIAGEKLDTMVCSAYQGDVLVSLTAHAAKSVDTTLVATLLREQLDRIAEPGEAV